MQIAIAATKLIYNQDAGIKVNDHYSVVVKVEDIIEEW